MLTVTRFPGPTDIPGQPTLSPPKYISIPPMAPRVDESQMALALADLREQAKPNYAGTARKYGLKRVTLYDRATGKSMSHQAATSMYHQRLTNAQEDVLIDRINYLSNRGIPPTSQMVRNLAEEMIGDVVGKNWTGEFVRRHSDKLMSVYLRNIDRARQTAEYVPVFQQFYDLVWLYSARFCTMLSFYAVMLIRSIAPDENGEIQYNSR
jgi:hypothetical protein